jgi:hypothetical protein
MDFVPFHMQWALWVVRANPDVAVAVNGYAVPRRL